MEAYLPQAGMLDADKERARLSRQAEKLSKDVQVLEGRLQSAGFVDRAPAHLVAEVRDKLSSLKEQLRIVEVGLQALTQQ